MTESLPLAPTAFLDFDHPDVAAFVREHTAGLQERSERITALYLAVRDSFRYDPYRIDFRPEGLRASNLVRRNHGYCVEKAVLLAACFRAIGIPARLFFGDVKNHIGVDRFTRIVGTERLIFHGATEMWTGHAWVKATPAFNRELCAMLNVPPLEFDGTADSMFQAYDRAGGQFMEYLHEYGSFDDMPYDQFILAVESGYGFDVRGKVIDLRSLDQT